MCNNEDAKKYVRTKVCTDRDNNEIDETTIDDDSMMCLTKKGTEVINNDEVTQGSSDCECHCKNILYCWF